MTYLAASRLRRDLHTAPRTLKRFTVPCRLNDVGLSQHLAQPQRRTQVDIARSASLLRGSTWAVAISPRQ
jgi:hypothetical protein